MPVTLRMEDSLLLIELSGEVTDHDLQTLVAEVLRREKEFPRTPNRLTDFTATTGLHLHYGDIDRIAQARRASPPANPIKNAVVGPRPVQFGIARMFQTLNDHPLVTVEVFRDRAAALAWLKEAPPRA